MVQRNTKGEALNKEIDFGILPNDTKPYNNLVNIVKSWNLAMRSIFCRLHAHKMFRVS